MQLTRNRDTYQISNDKPELHTMSYLYESYLLSYLINYPKLSVDLVKNSSTDFFHSDWKNNLSMISHLYLLT